MKNNLIKLGLVSVLAAPLFGVTPTTQSDGAKIQPTQVYACSIRFPLDSVRFNEGRLQNCLKSVKKDRISYIHIVATATPDGTNKHNLYLSNRRAGAIEGYLRNRFPEVQIHAFGGGENPKFGKLARIFVVENGTAGDVEGSLGVTMQPLEVEKVYVTQRDQPFQLLARTGGSRFVRRGSGYQATGIGMQYYLSKHPYYPVLTGLNYDIHRNDQDLDVHQFSLNITPKAEVLQIAKERKLLLSLPVQLGVVDADNWAVDPGLGLGLEYEWNRMSAAILASRSKHLAWVGLQLGANL